MSEWVSALFARLLQAPETAYHLTLGLAAALENLVPPIPADVVVLVGSFLAERRDASLGLVFLAVWGGNVAGALLVYLAGRRYGAAFFAGRWGRLLLRPRQLEALAAFYQKYGLGIIFISRFLPMFRAVVPVFAGIAHVGFWRTTLPIGLASAIWYGLLVYVGATAGRNWEAIVAGLQVAGRSLWLIAALLAAAVGWWWWRTRAEEGKP